MFRIDRRHVKIAGEDNIINPGQVQETAREEEMAAAQEGKQPSLPACPEEAAPQVMITEEMISRAKEEAEAIISGAKTMAEGILRDAREAAEAEALEIRGQAWKSGHQEGAEQAAEEARAGQESLAADLQTLADGIRAGRDEMYSRMEGDIVDLALAVARKVINAAIDREDEMYKSLIKNALNQMKLEGKLAIRMCEADVSRLFPGGTAVFQLGDRTVSATVAHDPHMGPGDCIIESEAEIIDAGVKSQLKAITLAFGRAGEGDGR